MTTAEIFADYLGLTPENAPWAFGKSYFYDCKCGKDCCDTASGDEIPICSSCENLMQYAYSKTTLTATSPLAPEPTPGWLEALVRHKKFNGLCNYRGNRFRAQWGETAITFAPHPTHAVARALIAADPTLREACERAGDYEKETSNG